MATVYEWPCLLMGSESDDWLLSGAAEGDRTVSGDSIVSRIDGGGLWTVTLADILIDKPAQLKSWAAITGLMDDGVGAVAIPYLVRWTQPFIRDETGAVVTYSDGVTHSDGSGIQQPAIVCSLEEAAALRATRIKIRRTHAAEFEAGEHFSIEHRDWGHRLYKVVSVVDDTDGVTTVDIRPPLRAATDPCDLEFDRPRCTMRIADPKGAGGPLTQRRFGKKTIAFIEFGRLPS